MIRTLRGIVGAVALLVVTTFSTGAAAQPVPQGRMKLAAERMGGVALNIPDGGDAWGSISVFGLGRPGLFQTPRVGFDYFVIDGLSLGGSAGLWYTGLGDGTFAWHVLPRIGYAFALSRKIDFWPRGGIGVGGFDQGGVFGGDDVEALIYFEGMFIWNFAKSAGIEFGPTADTSLDNGTTALAGNVGLVATF